MPRLVPFSNIVRTLYKMSCVVPFRAYPAVRALPYRDGIAY